MAYAELKASVQLELVDMDIVMDEHDVTCSIRDIRPGEDIDYDHPCVLTFKPASFAVWLSIVRNVREIASRENAGLEPIESGTIITGMVVEHKPDSMKDERKK